MKVAIKIEEVQKGDIVKGKEVVEVLHRCTGYVRLVLKGGEVVDGYRGQKVEVRTKRSGCVI